MKLNKISVTTPDQIVNLIDVMHDEYFDLDTVKYNEDAATVKIPYKRVFHDGPHRVIRNFLIFRTIEVDVIRSLLTIKYVKQFQVNDTAQINNYSFNNIIYDNGSITIRCEPDVELKLQVSDINIECEDVEVRGKAIYYEGFGWDSGPHKFYD